MIPGVCIENIIAATHLGGDFKPEELMSALGPAVVQDAPFDGVVIQQEDLRTAMLLFSNGRLVATGSKDFKTLETAFSRTIDQLKEAGMRTSRSVDVDVLNIIASGGVGSPLDLDKVAGLSKGAVVSYDPQLFEGLEMVLGETPEGTMAKVLIFRSGRMVFTGTTTQRSLELAVERAAEVLAAAGDGIYVKGQ